MDRLNGLIERLRSFQDSVNAILEEIVRANEDVILSLNTDEQLYDKGIDRQGAAVGVYSPITIAIKSKKGQPTDRVTLKDTGAFHRSFYLEFQKDGFEIKASDPKTLIILSDWGSGVLGLTDASLDLIIEDYIKPQLLQEFRKRIL